MAMQSHPSGPDPSEEANAALAQYSPALHQYLRRHLKNPQDVQDLSQDVLTRYWQISQRETVRHPQALLYRLASNFIYEFRVRAQKTPITYDSELVNIVGEASAEAWVDEVSQGLDASQQIEQALRKLPKLWQAVLLLVKREGLSAAEAGQKLGLSEKTIYNYLGCAIADFRKAYGSPR